MEISKIVGEALEYSIFLEQFPRTSIDVYIAVLQANAGTRCAGLTAASVAVADAGIPMRDLIPACAAGKVADTIVLDLNKEEDNFGDADLPLAYIPRTGEVLLLQMDGHLTQAEFNRAIELAKGGCSQIYAVQQDALRRKYSIAAGENGGKEEEARGNVA